MAVRTLRRKVIIREYDFERVKREAFAPTGIHTLYDRAEFVPLNQEAIEKYGLYNLSEFLPKKPGEIELKVMKEMFEASVDGEPYDMERWGQYFKPAGMGQATGDPNTSKAKPVTTTDDDDDAPFDTGRTTTAPAPKTDSTATSGDRAQDILAMIRNRNK